MAEFRFQIEEIKKIDARAAQWSEERDLTTWLRDKFSSNAKCGTIHNNIAKSFNSTILPARDKPMITMVEII